jgi:streptogramin lyase
MTIKLSSLKKRKKFKERLSPPQVGIMKTFGDYGDTIAKWVGGALAPNGNIYAAPYNTNAILKIDPIDETSSTIPVNLEVSVANYRGIVCAKNGKLYTIPSGQVAPIQKVLEFDPQNNSHRFFTDSPEGNWYGGVLAPNGNIYGIPFGASSILEINPTAGTATTSTISNNVDGYVGGVLGPNGKIYCIPFSATTVLEIDPNVGTASTFGSLSVGTKWANGVLANNGKIYGIPYLASSILEIDPIARTVSTFGESSDIWSSTDPGWASAALGSDGKIYAFPSPSGGIFTDYILKIDPDTKTLSLVYSTASQYYIGAVAARNGKIYGIPGNSSSVVAIGVSAANKSPQWVTKPYEVQPRVGFTTVLSNVGPLESEYQYISGCLGNDGNIYALPFGFDTTNVLKINPNKETFELLKSIPPYIDTFDFGGSISASISTQDGIICGVPFNRKTAIFYDPKTDQYTESNNITIAGQWISGSLAPNGKIYCPPNRGNKIIVINSQTRTISTDTFSSIGTYNDTLSSPTNWCGSVLAPNGKIYGIPGGETRILEIDPINETATTFGSLSSSLTKWWGGILAPNGKIYGIPYSSTSVLEIDPNNRTATTFGNISSFLSSEPYGWNGILGADGKIYIIPWNHNKIIRIDPETKTLSLYGTIPDNINVFAGVLAPNGNIYMLPSGYSEVINFTTVYTQAALISIGTTQNYQPANWMLSSYTNKSV